MGASGWIYYAEFDPHIDDVLASLHERVLASGDFLWTGDEVPRPKTVRELRELCADEDNEHIAEEGTHSVLDIDRALVGAEDEAGAMLLFTEAAMREKLGTHRPSREQFDAAYKAGKLVDFPAWSGRFAPLYEDGRPTALVVWGHSGD